MRRACTPARAAGLAQNVLTDSLDEITGRIKLEKRQRRIVIFNPLAIERTDVARVTRFREAKPFDLIDEATGEKVAYQIVELSGPLVPAPYAAQRWARGQFEKAELYDLVFVRGQGSFPGLQDVPDRASEGPASV